MDGGFGNYRQPIGDDRAVLGCAPRNSRPILERVKSANLIQNMCQKINRRSGSESSVVFLLGPVSPITNRLYYDPFTSLPFGGGSDSRSFHFTANSRWVPREQLRLPLSIVHKLLTRQHRTYLMCALYAQRAFEVPA